MNTFIFDDRNIVLVGGGKILGEKRFAEWILPWTNRTVANNNTGLFIQLKKIPVVLAIAIRGISRPRALKACANIGVGRV